MAGCLLQDSEIKNPVPGRVWIMTVTCNQRGLERVSKVYALPRQRPCYRPTEWDGPRHRTCPSIDDPKQSTRRLEAAT